MKNFFKSNLNEEENIKNQRGWFIGHFADDPFKTRGFEIKWSKHKAGDKKDSPAYNKSAKTVWVLISGKVKIVFPDQKTEFIMDKEGEYCFYDSGVSHTWEILEDCVSVNIRWPSLPNDQVENP